MKKQEYKMAKSVHSAPSQYNALQFNSTANYIL